MPIEIYSLNIRKQINCRSFSLLSWQINCKMDIKVNLSNFIMNYIVIPDCKNSMVTGLKACITTNRNKKKKCRTQAFYSSRGVRKTSTCLTVPVRLNISALVSESIVNPCTCIVSPESILICMEFSGDL